jgi:hypothetical protein
MEIAVGEEEEIAEKYPEDIQHYDLDFDSYIIDEKDWTGWMKYEPKFMVKKMLNEEFIKKFWESALLCAKDEVEEKIAKWWSYARERFDHEESKFAEIVENTIPYHLERKCIYDHGVVCDLKRWRNARRNCMYIIRSIECTLRNERKEKFFEYDDPNDPPIPKIPKEIRLEAWKSYSIVAFEANCYGLYNLENVYINAGRICKEYYKKFKEIRWDVLAGNIFDMGIGDCEDDEEYDWYKSSFYRDAMKEFRYRGYIKNSAEYTRQCQEALKIASEIEMGIEEYFKVGFQPLVPICSMISGKFIMKISEFIEKTITVWVEENRDDMKSYMNELFKKFARSTIVNITKKLIGSIDDTKVKVKIITDSLLRNNLIKEMSEVEMKTRDMERVDAMYIKRTQNGKQRG